MAAAPAVNSQSYYLKHFQVEDGLSNNSVTCSLQDKMGFMWFGTKDGLNRFNGYSFKVFRKTEGNPHSIGSSFIHCLHEDSQGTMWVGTEQGLYQYVDKTEEFRVVPATANMYVDAITTDSLGNLWFISYFQLYRYERNTKKLEAYPPDQYFVATSICTTKDGSLLVGTSDGHIRKYNSQSNTFSDFNLFERTPSKPHKWIESVYTTRSGTIIAGTSDTEIKLFDPVTATYRDITIPGSKQPSLYIRSVLQTAPDELWLGTQSGIFIYDLNTGNCVHLEKEYNNPYSITDNVVFSMCQDREGGVWVGTYYGGVNYHPDQNTPFTRYFPKKGENALSGNIVGDMVMDRQGHLWIGTDDAGLNQYDTATGMFTHFEPDGRPGSISFFALHGLLVTGDSLWIGTFQHGLDLLNIRTGKVIRHYEAGRDGFDHDFIYCIYRTHSGQILIGTATGVFRYRREVDRFERFDGLPPGSWYSSVLQDENGVFWGSTFGSGLHSYNPANGKKQTFQYQEKDTNSLSNNRVTSLFEDSRHQLWVATEGGLCLWNRDKNNFTRYGSNTGFPSDFILSLLEDQQQNLWISTTKGLVRFHPSSGRIKVYNVSNGLISDQFNYSSAFKAPDGRMYFGSDKGLISFDPAAFRQDTYVSPVYITGFRINGQELAIDPEKSSLHQSIIYTDRIVLPYDQATISIDFAALNYKNPEGMEYQYLMYGLSDRWITQRTDRSADFIELAPGSYTFRIRAINSDGIWSQESRLSIRILPPWWSGTPARIVYGLLAAFLVFSIVRYYSGRMKEKTRRKYEMLEIEKEKELLESKIEFFTNVAHEIKTPLTLIRVPLSKVMKKIGGNPEVERSLQIMNRNTKRLIELTTQLLDFRKTEINRYQLSLERTNISELVTELCAGFESLSEDRNLQLELQLPDTPFYAMVDLDAFSKIIYNLFSNAVKYAATSVWISLRQPDRDGQPFVITVKNDGYLIPEDLREKIFEPFYRVRATESHTGTGIGLALARSLAQLHGGTLNFTPSADSMNVFTLILPINGIARHGEGKVVRVDQPAKENLNS